MPVLLLVFLVLPALKITEHGVSRKDGNDNHFKSAQTNRPSQAERKRRCATHFLCLLLWLTPSSPSPPASVPAAVLAAASVAAREKVEPAREKAEVRREVTREAAAWRVLCEGLSEALEVVPVGSHVACCWEVVEAAKLVLAMLRLLASLAAIREVALEPARLGNPSCLGP